MYKVMIVEDSKSIMNHLIGCVKRTDPRLHIEAVAYNGEEALELLELHTPDIIITDIRMPVMDGLALLTVARKRLPQLKCVIISGFDDFEYARQALRLQIEDYLLKPVEPSELEETLHKLIRSVDEEKNRNAYGILDALMNGDKLAVVGDKESDPKARYHLALYRAERDLENRTLNGETDQTLPSFEKLHPNGWRILLVESAYTELFSSWFQDRLQSTAADGTVVQGIFTRKALSSAMLFTEYTKMAHYFDNHFVFSKSLTEASENCGSVPFYKDVFTEIEKWDRNLQHWIPLLPIEKVQEELHYTLKKWKEQRYTRTMIRKYLGAYLNFVHRLCIEQGFAPRFDPDQTEVLFRTVISYTQLQALMQRNLVLLYEGIRQHTADSSEEWYQAIEAFLTANIYNQVTIQDITSRFNVSTSYLHRIFKKHAGISPIEYLTRLKMKEAKQLFCSTPHITSKKLSEMLGFNDQHYFSKVFKGYAGCSPTEYRRTHLSQK